LKARALILLVALLSAGAARAQGVEGSVFEVANPEAPRGEWRRAPSAGAFVVVHWTGRVPQLWHYKPVCLQASIGRTDGQGRFVIPAPRPASTPLFLIRDEPAVALYKPGFDAPAALRSPGEWVLVRTSLKPLERAGVLEVFAEYGCRDEEKYDLIPLTDPQGVLPAFHRALYDEAAALGVDRRPQLPMQIRVLPRSGPAPAEMKR
jgi:hypothetical protein